MKRLVLITAFFLVSINSFSQKEFNNWFFGANAGITFNTTPPTAVTVGALSSLDQTSTISDASGNLIMYSDGIHVYNRNHIQMPNGFDLLGAGVTISHASIIAQQPGSPNLYYIFTVVYFGYPAGFQYAVVDMTLNSGNGDVISKNNMLITPVCEKLTAVKHQNGTDIWVITHLWNSDAFYAYLLTSTGISAPVITHIGPVHTGGISYNYYNSQGQLTATNDGSKLALAVYDLGLIEVLDFNNSTGIVSNPIDISSYPNAWGVQFSPDRSKLYFTQWTYSAVHQLNLLAGTATDIANSATVIGTATSPDPTYKAGFLQLGPDNKIYDAKYGSGYISVINNPNNLGTACNFVDDGVYLSGNICKAGLPNYIQTYFNVPDFIVQNVCQGDSAVFQSQNLTGFSSYNWNFGDPSSGLNNTSALLNPAHLYNNSGTYNITLITQQGSVFDTIHHTVTINPLPQVDLGNDTTLCSNNSFNLNAGNSGNTFLWSTGATSQTISVINSGSFSVSVSNGNCSAFDTIQVNFQPLNVNIGNDTAICGSPSLTLNAGNTGSSFIWSTGATDQTITVTTAGSYSVTVSNGSCLASDNIQVAFASPPSVSLGPDTTLCYGTSISLNAANGGASYIWSTGEQSPTIAVSSPGTYNVEVSIGLCHAYDTIVINVLPKIDLGGNRSLCDNPQILLSVPDNVSSFTWSTGSQNSRIIISEPGIYWLSVISGNCFLTDTITIDGGMVDLFLPNAFTPNGDGVNDYFGPMGQGITDCHFMIFSAWGEKIFESNNINDWWDGTYKSKFVSTGIYVWEIDYNSICEKKIRKYGTVMVFY